MDTHTLCHQRNLQKMDMTLLDGLMSVILLPHNQEKALRFPIMMSHGGIIKFVAQWEFTNVTVTFDTNGANETLEDIYTSERNITLPLVTKPGYYLYAWGNDDESNVIGSAGEKINIKSYANNDGVCELVAVWGYKIKYDLNSGTGGTEETIVRYDEGSMPNSFTLPTKTGCKFLGWKIKNTDTVDISRESIIINKSLTILI